MNHLQLKLPNLSNNVSIRDAILLLFLIPFVIVKNKISFLNELWTVFMIVVLIKAVCIFFTIMPSSHPRCFEKKYVNHCFHNSISGHAGFFLLLALLYIRHGVFNEYILIFAGLYGLLIVMTRAHYTVDVITALIVTYLLFINLI